MNIHEKLADIQNNLMGMKLPKTGKNKFAKFGYYELEDILPAIFKECFKHELTMVFTFPNGEALLKLKSWNKATDTSIDDELTVRIPMPPIEKMNNGMNIMQSEGSYLTYLKRYLLINTFLIMEKDIVDSDALSQPEISAHSTARTDNGAEKEGIKSKPVKDYPPTSSKPVQSIIAALNKKGVPVNKETMAAQLKTKSTWHQDLKDQVTEYIERMEA